MKNKIEDLEVVTIGKPDIRNLSEEEQKAFYVALITQILGKRLQDLEDDTETGLSHRKRERKLGIVKGKCIAPGNP